jgi:hypothetical protein
MTLYKKTYTCDYSGAGVLGILGLTHLIRTEENLAVHQILEKYNEGYRLQIMIHCFSQSPAINSNFHSSKRTLAVFYFVILYN